MIKRIFLALSITTLLVGCDILFPPGNASSGTPTEIAPDLGHPEGVAQAYLTAWMAGDFAGMYSLLSPNSQTEYTLEAFSSLYRSTATTMTLKSLEATPLSALSEATGTTAQFAFHVIYHTTVLGDIAQDITMQMIFANARWGIAWSPSLIFPALASGNTLQLEVTTPSRANIYDRNGKALVTADAATVTIQVVPGQISPDYEDQMLALLSVVLRTPPDQIRQNYAGLPPDYTIAVGDADAEIFQAHYQELKSYPGLYFVDKTSRRYFNVLAPHVLGYTSFIPKDQLDDYKSLGYQGDEIVGLSGLEKWGESYLAGTRGGTLSAYTSDGQYFAQVSHKDSQPSQSLYATLDRDLQAMVQDTIQEAYTAGAATWAPKAGGATVVVLDVHTGEVLAMANYPAFDPNVLNPQNAHPLMTDAYIKDITTNPLRPFLNRATQGEYPPGSVFKIVSMSAAMGSGIMTPDYTYTCTGVWEGLGADNPRYDWKEGGHGTITLRQALTGSCNPFFYEIGLLTAQKDFNILPDYARQYGFGQTHDLQVEEEPGLIPDPDWLLKTRGETWTNAHSVNMAIGQGDVLVAPLQIATMIAAVANGGTVYKPQFVSKVGLLGETPSITFSPEVFGHINLTPDQLATIRASMYAVTSDQQLGTAEYRLGSLSERLPVAGKTGTAQLSGSNAPPIAWFAGFAPYENPEIAVVVMIENGGQGSAVAAPIFRRIIERYYSLPVLDWPPDWSDPTTFPFVTNDLNE
jgi:penicillin-binding protein 2